MNKEITELGKVHILGLGGAGMSGIARLLVAQGVEVSGTDAKESRRLESLRKLGVKVFVGHSPDNLLESQTVIFSTAIKENNPELQAAREKNLRILKRSDARMSSDRIEMKSPIRDSSAKNLMRHVLNLGGRELVIEGSRGGFTSEMALGLIKTVSLQLTLEPDAPELVATFESGGQLLRVRIQGPKKSDRSKLSEVLMQLVS